MLRGWPIALVAATGASGLFAFGLVQSAFATQAFALFIVFGAVLAIMMLANRMFGGGGHAAHAGAHGGGEHAVVMSGRSVGTIAVVAAFLALLYFWTDNDLSGEKIGRYIDRGAAIVGQQAQNAFVQLTDGRRDQIPAEEQSSSQEG